MGAQMERVAGDAPFAPAKGEPHQGTLPVHPHGQRGDFAESDTGMVAQPPFDRPPRQVVLHPVAKKNFCVPVVPLDRDGDSDQAFRPFAAFADSFVQFEKVRSSVKLAGGHMENLVV